MLGSSVGVNGRFAAVVMHLVGRADLHLQLPHSFLVLSVETVEVIAGSSIRRLDTARELGDFGDSCSLLGCKSREAPCFRVGDVCAVAGTCHLVGLPPQ